MRSFVVAGDELKEIAPTVGFDYERLPHPNGAHRISLVVELRIAVGDVH